MAEPLSTRKPGAVPELKQGAREVFEGCGDHYATERERLPYFQAQMAIMLSMMEGARNGVILDIGCAAGGEIGPLLERGFRVVGLDFSESMLELGSRRFAGDARVAFCRADAEKLPVKDGSVDHVVCLGVFEFLPDQEAAVQEIHRVMRPGGVVVFAIPSRISFYNVAERVARDTVGPVWRAAKRLLGRGPKGPVVQGAERNLVVPWKFRAVLRQMGFAPQRSAYSNYFLYPLDRFPGLNVKVAAALEPLAKVPLMRCGASVYLVSATRN